MIHVWCDNLVHFVKNDVHLIGVCSSEKSLKITFGHSLLFNIRTINIIFKPTLASPLMKEFSVLIASWQPNGSGALSPSYFFLKQKSIDIISHSLY